MDRSIDAQLRTKAFVTRTMLLFAGHAHDYKQPSDSFPLAVFLYMKMSRDLGCPLLVLAVLSLSCLVLSQHQDGGEASSLPLTPPIASAEVEQEGCPTDEVHQIIRDNIQPLIQTSTSAVLPCTVRVKGKVPHCPASSCMELFNLAQEEGLIFVSNYYWLVGITGEVRKVYCNRETQQPEFSSCEELLAISSTVQDGVYPIRLSNGTHLQMYCNFTKQRMYASCKDLYQAEPNAPPGFYYIQLPNGSVTAVFCDSNTVDPYPTCQNIPSWPNAPSGIYPFQLPNGSHTDVYCNNVTGEPEYTSCAHAHQVQPNLPSGSYTIRPAGGSPVAVYCDMDREECSGGGWTRVASYNYSDPSISCPTTWIQITDPFRGCALTGAVRTNNCASTLFSTLTEFNQVCGEVIAIQHDHPDGFNHQNTIDSDYVEGVSITHGSPRQHIWTFAAYPSDNHINTNNICPCSQPSLNVPPPPSFVGSNYFCDTAVETTQRGWHLDDPLWDGEGCPSNSTCCSFNNPPWFIATLPQHTSDDIEVRICDAPNIYDDTAIIMLNLYVR